MPHCNACSALTLSPSNVMPSALALPTRRGMLQVAPISGTMPRLGPKVATKNAEWAATVMSQAKAKPNPPPAAGPLIRAIVGTGQSISARMAALKSSPCLLSSVTGFFGSAACTKSAPAQKPLPLPVRITTLIASLLRTTSSAWEMPRINSLVMAFMASGRLSVMVATPSS